MDELFKDYYEEQKKLEAVERNCKTCAEEDNYEHPEYCERCIGCDRWKPKSPRKPLFGGAHRPASLCDKQFM